MRAYKPLIAGLLTAVLMLCIGSNVLASSNDTYLYVKNGEAVSAPSPAEYSFSIRGEDTAAGAFSSPQDLFCTPQGDLYIADTQNNRIIIFERITENIRGAGIRIIDKFENNGTEDTFKAPRGIFIDAENNLFVADTENARIVKLNSEGKLMQIYEAPSGTALPKGFEFKPAKLTLDSYNQMFVISDGHNAGLMEFDTNGQYMHSMGAPRVAVSLVEQFWRRFSTKAQRERSQNFVPTEYSNVSIDDDGFLFVTTAAYNTAQFNSGILKPLRKLNAKGRDIFNRVGDPVGDNLSGGLTYKGASAFGDICHLGYGNFALLDQKRGRVFAYNEDGELLYIFGEPGAFAGGMLAPSAVTFFDNKYYILNAGKNEISVFDLTEYGELFSGIAKARQEIDFETEEALWSDVMMRNSNCTLAMNGLGNAAYKRKDMSAAMRFYKMSGDRTNYSKAYAFVRREWIENNSWVLLLVILLIVGAIIAAIHMRKYLSAAVGKHPYLKSVSYSFHILFHPMDGFWDLKREKRGSFLSALTLLGGCIAVIVISSLATGFIFNPTNLETYNILNVGYILAAVVIWVISQWCVTSLMYGEGKMKDIFIATCYSLTPYILVNSLAIILSRLLLSAEGDLYFVLIALSVFWMVILLIASVKQTHDFSMSKAFLSIAITLLVILLIVFIGMLVLALSQQLISFIRELIDEAAIRI